jgi:surface protein
MISRVSSFRGAGNTFSVYENNKPTPTPPPFPLLKLTFDNISNADILVGDSSNLTDWNTFFDLPNNGNPFTYLIVSGNTIDLCGGSDITIFTNAFISNVNILNIDDNGSIVILNGGCFAYSTIQTFSSTTLVSMISSDFYQSTLQTITAPLLVSCGSQSFGNSNLTSIDLPSLTIAPEWCFNDTFYVTSINLPSLRTASFDSFRQCGRFSSGALKTISLPSLTGVTSFSLGTDLDCFVACTTVETFDLPSLEIVGDMCFRSCSSAKTFNLPSVTNLGSSVAYNNVFESIGGNTIDLTIPSVLMTCNGGNPDGDIQNLQSNNTVNITEIPPSLKISFNDISSAYIMVGDPSNVSDWNSFFTLPGYGNPFTGVTIVQNDVYLSGGSDITIRGTAFKYNSNVTSFVDRSNCVVSCSDFCFQDCFSVKTFDLPGLVSVGWGSFQYCTSVKTFNLPNLVTIGDGSFQVCSSVKEFNLPNVLNTGGAPFAYCSSVTKFNLSSCINLGGTAGNNDSFLSITGKTIDLTVPEILMTCNGGNPDGDIQYLQANNNVTIHTVTNPTPTPTSTPTNTPTPTSTPTPTITSAPGTVEITFINISNADLLVGDATNLNDWNTFFDLPNYGTPFTSVTVNGNTVNLYGGSNITIKNNLFYGNTNIISFHDVGSIVDINGYSFIGCASMTGITLSSLVTISGENSLTALLGVKDINFPNLISITGGNVFENNFNVTGYSFPSLTSITSQSVFRSNNSLTTITLPSLINLNSYDFVFCLNLSSVNLPNVVNTSIGNFFGCTSLSYLSIPSCTNLGGTIGNDNNFGNITGNTINLTVNPTLLTCNGGNPDGDIQWLQSNNTVILNGITPTPTPTPTSTETPTPTSTETPTSTPTSTSTPTPTPLPFISVWRTTTPNDTIELPYQASGTYTGTIDWGDGFTSANTYTNRTHTYSSSGTYSVIIDGTVSGFTFGIGNANAPKIKEIIQWGTGFRLGNDGLYFTGCENLVLTGVTDTLNLNGTTDLNNMFSICYSLTTINNINDWDVSNVTDMNNMFAISLDFNQSLSGWTTSAVTNMAGMFYSTSFNQDIGSWNVSGVTNMATMFNTTPFNQDIGSWNVSNVIDMDSMFSNTSSFNQDIGSWNVSSVLNMPSMFANSQFNQNISSWNVSGVTNMTYMFNNATSFNQDLSNWCVTNIPSLPSNFDYNTTAWTGGTATRPQWGTCP